MGANATTFVPSYTSGEVLTAANLSVTNSGIPVFADSTARDAAFGGTGEKTLAEGQYAYLEDTNATQFYDGASWVSVGTTPGLVYITSATASASAALNINSCFSSTYTNYRIIYNFTASTTLELQMRFRLVTTDYSGTEYTDYGFGMGSGGSFNLQHVNTTQFTIGYVNTTEPIHGSMDIYSPNVAVKTNFSNLSGIAASIYENGRVNTTTQYDGFSLLASTGNITGTVKIYGYSNS
jgi:hypothetical protein